jgi:hypothetical protein
VESHFTLTQQADAWIDYLKALPGLQRRSMAATTDER